MLSRMFWFFFGLAVLDIAAAIPQAPAKWNSPRAASATSQKPVDCPKFPDDTQNLEFPKQGCLNFLDVIEEGGMAEIRREVNVPRSDPRTAKLLLAIRGPTRRVIRFYVQNLKANLQKKNLHIKLTFVRFDKRFEKGPQADGKTSAEKDGGPCHVVIKIIPEKPAVYLAQQIAHELYHCVQFQEHPNLIPPEKVFLWVLDGSANFFTYLQYPMDPSTDLDANAPHYYDPKVPLYHDDQQYTSCLFFHFLLNSGWSLEQIDTWVRTRKLLGESAEQAALAADPKIGDAFGKFATMFHDKKIYFDANSLYRINTDMQPGNEVPARPLEGINLPEVGDKDFLDIEDVVSWTFKKYSVRLQDKQTVSTTLTWAKAPAPNVVVWSRALRQGKRPSAWAKTLPKVHSGCNGAVDYEFLVVPITDADTVSGTLHFKREEDDKCSCPVKSPGSAPIKRIPAIDGRNVDLLVPRQQGNHSGSCTASLTTSSPTQGPPSTPSMNIAEVIWSIIGIDPSTIVLSTSTLSYATTACESSQTSPIDNAGTYNATIASQAQKTLIPIPPIATLANSRITESHTTQPNPRITESNRPTTTSSPVPSTQEFETSQTLPSTTVQEPPTTTPSSDPNSPGSEDWLEEGEEWDGSWPSPNESPLSEEPEEETDPEDDEVSCASCLIGTWSADKASMETHSQKPYFWYIHPGFDFATAKFSATYKLTFQAPPSGEQPIPGEQMSFSLHEELVEEGQHTRSSDNGNNNRNVYRTVSTSIIDYLAPAYGKVTGDYEVGTIYKPLTPTSSGEVKIAWDGGSFEPWLKDDKKARFGPPGYGFSYNCTGDTLYYESNSGGRNYVFQRG